MEPMGRWGETANTWPGVRPPPHTDTETHKGMEVVGLGVWVDSPEASLRQW